MKYTWTISSKRSWQSESEATSVDVVAANPDAALDRFWVYRWKNNRDRRNERDILSIVRGVKVVV